MELSVGHGHMSRVQKYRGPNSTPCLEHKEENHTQESFHSKLGEAPVDPGLKHSGGRTYLQVSGQNSDMKIYPSFFTKLFLEIQSNKKKGNSEQ